MADFTDTAHPHALALTSERAASPIVTTDEVLTEYLTFFSTAPEQMRREVAASVQGILESTVDPRPATPRKKATFAGDLFLLRIIAGEGFEPPTFGL